MNTTTLAKCGHSLLTTKLYFFTRSSRWLSILGRRMFGRSQLGRQFRRIMKIKIVQWSETNNEKGSIWVFIARKYLCKIIPNTSHLCVLHIYVYANAWMYIILNVATQNRSATKTCRIYKQQLQQHQQLWKLQQKRLIVDEVGKR